MILNKNEIRIMTDFFKKAETLKARHEALLSRKNKPEKWGNGIYTRYK